MTREELIREFNVEERVDELISLVADADVIARTQQRVANFLENWYWKDCDCIMECKMLLDGLETLQNHLRTLLDAHRNGVTNHLISCITSWFVDYDDIVEDTEKEFEYFIDQLIRQALEDFEVNVPLYTVRPADSLEREFAELSVWVVDQLEDQLQGKDIVKQVLDHIRFW